VSQLANFIEARREAISERWADQLFASGVPESVHREDVIDNMREFLGEMAEGLRKEHGFQQHSTSVEASALAKGHGKQRFRMGYDVGAMVREYGTLRDVFFQMMEEAGLSPSVRELRVLSKYLIGGIADAAGQYALERDAEQRHQASEHIGFLAHELRNPLSSALLALEAMRRKGELPETPAVLRLQKSLGRVSELIDNALVEVRLRASLQLQRAVVDVDVLLHGMAADSATEVEAKGLTVTVEAPMSLTLSADPRLLRSALSNLVRNAVKFSHEGGTLHLRARVGGGRLVMEVEDSCGGLPEGRLKSLFDPFVQVGKDRSGFGLGLAIARQAVEAHGGELRVHNLPGKGCVFILDLPLQPLPPKEG
jgi:hypothetical protein